VPLLRDTVEEGRGLHQLRIEHRVLLHQPHLRRLQRIRLQQDRVGHTDLSDVVRQKPVAKLGIGGELRRDRARESEPELGHTMRVLAGLVVAQLERCREERHHRVQDVSRDDLRRHRRACRVLARKPPQRHLSS
jgi:hypothetical protein